MAKRKLARMALAKRQKTERKVLLSEEEINDLAAKVSDKDYNSLVPLLEQYAHLIAALQTTEDESVESVGRLLTLVVFKSFQKLWKDGLMVEDADSDKRALVAKWLLSKYDAFKRHLLQLVETPLAFESSLQVDALEIYLACVKLESKRKFAGETYKQLVRSLLVSPHGEVLSTGQTCNFLVLEFIEQYAKAWDLQYHFFDGLDTTLSNNKNPTVFANYYTVVQSPVLNLEDIESLDTFTPAKLGAGARNPAAFKTQFQKAFHAVLSFQLTTAQYKSVLTILHKRIIPYMARPLSLMDFLTDCYDVDDDVVVPILALNSLWELMKRYNLEYPDFYAKLYSLLTPDLLYTRYRLRFFRLCDLFLSSTHLSSQLIASFIKKLARLALSASAPGVVVIIPFIYNLLKKHPSCMVLVHNTKVDDNYVDPYNDTERDPLHTHALGSSLWELETLMNHYHPNVATLAKIFAEPFRKPNYNMEDFLDWTYVSLLDSEKTRRYKAHAALEHEAWPLVFGETAYLSGWTL